MKPEPGKLYELTGTNGIFRCRGLYSRGLGKPTGPMYAFARPREPFGPEQDNFGYSAHESQIRWEVTAHHVPGLRKLLAEYQRKSKGDTINFDEEIADLVYAIAELEHAEKVKAELEETKGKI